MYKKLINITISLSLSCLVILFVLISNEIKVQSYAKTVAELEQEIKELEKKYDSTKKQAESLSRELNIIDNNIKLKTVQIQKAGLIIEQKEKEIDDLREEIDLLEIRLDRLDENIEKQQELFEYRVRKQYMESQKPLLEKILSIKNKDSFLAKLEYIRRIQNEDKILLDKMEITKDNYEDQQNILKDKKEKVLQIKTDLENTKRKAEELKIDLDNQKLQKKDLLRVTKNDEARYKSLIEAAQKELDQIREAANIVIREGKGVDVEKGENIGTMGNSGYSTGAHLHFGVYKYKESDFKKLDSWDWYYKNYINPIDVLKPQTVLWDTGCSKDPKGHVKTGKGEYSWPMKSLRITQSFGNNTCYNWMYGGKPHPALDMVGVGSYSVVSIADGKAYFCRNCLNDGGNGVFVFHKNDKMSVYWHLK